MKTIWYLVAFVTTPFLWGAAVVIGMVANNPTGYQFKSIEILFTFALFYWAGMFGARWIFRKELRGVLW